VRGRLHATAFVLLCLLGSVAAVGLTVREVAHTSAVSLDVTSTSRTGNTTTVTVLVHNTTGTARCVAVRIAARDRGGRDLATVTAAQALSLPAHARRSVRGSLTLTTRQYDEQLHAYYPSTRACPDS
jgi:hypothetical protein